MTKLKISVEPWTFKLLVGCYVVLYVYCVFVYLFKSVVVTY